MQLKYLTMLFAIIALSLAAAACSGGDDDTSSNGDQPAATTEVPDSGGNGDQPTATTEASSDGDGNGDDGDGGGNDGGGFGSGTATLTIGDETWEISGVGCVFSAEEAQNPDFPFNLAGSGKSSTGARAQLNASIYDPSGHERHEGEGVSHDIIFTDIDDFENPSVSWSSLGDPYGLYPDRTVTHLEIDGKNISGEALFDDGTTDEIETVPGTLEVRCP